MFLTSFFFFFLISLSLKIASLFTSQEKSNKLKDEMSLEIDRICIEFKKILWIS